MKMAWGNALAGQRPLLDADARAQNRLRDRAVGVVRGLVAGQYAGIRGAIVGDGKAAIRGHDIHVKIDEPLTADGSAGGSHAVGGVAGGAGEAGVDVAGVPAPARGALHNR